MNNLEILHFEQLKAEIQAQYLKNHTPSNEDIRQWKGIDIVYFQEDLRKFAKGNISEKSFYTYFKNPPVNRLPRIDILNLLSIYAGYTSWFDFKKQHLFANEILQETEELTENDEEELEQEIEQLENVDSSTKENDFAEESSIQNPILQKSNTVNQEDNTFSEKKEEPIISHKKAPKNFVKETIWLVISSVLAILVGVLIFKDDIFSKKFYYNFVDADRNSKINAELQVQILKDNESPILYTAKPNEPFVYTTKSKTLTMVVSSPYYKTDTIRRNLETASENEMIELKPNDYAIMLFYYTRSITDLKKKRAKLDGLISDNALIYQIYDNEKYGVETMDKQRYISLVTLPTTSLENLDVIDTKTDNSGKINMIKFKIKANENK